MWWRWLILYVHKNIPSNSQRHINTCASVRIVLRNFCMECSFWTLCTNRIVSRRCWQSFSPLIFDVHYNICNRVSQYDYLNVMFHGNKMQTAKWRLLCSTILVGNINHLCSQLFFTGNIVFFCCYLLNSEKNCKSCIWSWSRFESKGGPCRLEQRLVSAIGSVLTHRAKRLLVYWLAFRMSRDRPFHSKDARKVLSSCFSVYCHNRYCEFTVSDKTTCLKRHYVNSRSHGASRLLVFLVTRFPATFIDRTWHTFEWRCIWRKH